MTRQIDGFNHANLISTVNKISAMKKLLIALAMVGMHSVAEAGSQPLDFAYRVTGGGEMKPVLVFNDGTDTFIQPQEGASGLLVNGADPVRQGPYYVVQGVAKEITVSVPKKGAVVISYRGKRLPQVVAGGEQIEKTKVEKPSLEQLPAAKLSATVEEMVKAKPAEVVVKSVAPIAPKAASCNSVEKRSSAFVVSFKSGSPSFSNQTHESILQLVGKGQDVSNVEVIVEGPNKALAGKRAEAIKKSLIEAGIKASGISVTHRAQTFLGSEIHLEKEVSMPCAGAQIVSITSKSSPVTIIWNGDGKLLAEKIAKALSLEFTVEGDSKIALPVVVSATKESFGDAMGLFGDELGNRADFILSRGKAVLILKGDTK